MMAVDIAGVTTKAEAANLAGLQRHFGESKN